MYVVATPIGNLEDLTFRAARVLAEATIIAAENSQTAAKLFRHLRITPRCIPYNDRNKARTTAALLAALEAGESVALISEAGTPAISDPGQDLVAAAIAIGAAVAPIPGPSAVATLLSVAGLRVRTVRILGFLPRRRGERRRLLQEIAAQGEPALAFESPHRLLAAMEDIVAVLPASTLVVGRELTKWHEEIWRGSPAAALEHFRQPRGEFTLLLVPPATSGPAPSSDAAVLKALQEERAAGRRRAAAAAAVATRMGRSRKEVYALWPEAEGRERRETDSNDGGC